MSGKREEPPEAYGSRKLRVHFVRHAQSTNNVLTGTEEHKQAVRSCDADVTDLGRRQLEALGKYFATRADVASKVVHVFASPMTRAIKTAKPIAAACTNADFRILHEAFEVGGCYEQEKVRGRFETVARPGMSRSAIEALAPGIKVPESLGEAGWWFGSGRETEDGAESRVRRLRDALGAMAKTITRSAKKSVSIVVVVHADLLNLLFQLITAGKFDHARFFGFYNCSVSTVDFHDDGECVDILGINNTVIE